MLFSKWIVRTGTGIGLLLALTGCGENRSADEWLQLSITGLAGMDQYSFAGESVTSTSGGYSYGPKKFEGKVLDHKLLASQTNDGGELLIQPNELLLSLKNVGKEVTFGEPQEEADRLSLLVHIHPDDAGKMWSKLLSDELEQIALNEPPANASYKKEWDRELKRSREELGRRLQSLEVNSDYEIIVDRNRMIPLSMSEKSVLSYRKKGQTVQETRQSDVSFGAFSSASSMTEARKLNK